MSYSVTELERLCESWWRRIESFARDEQHRFAERFLSLLEWQRPSPLAMPLVLNGPPPMSYLLDEEHKTPIAAHFVMPGGIEPPSTVIERGLDFCLLTRRLVEATRMIGIPYALVTDFYRSYFYDTRSEELILHADCPGAFLQEFGQTLVRSEVDADSLEDLRREPRSVVARQLREWCARWANQLAAETMLPPEQTGHVLDRLLVMRYWSDAGGGAEGPGLRFGELLQRSMHGDSTGIGEDLCSLFLQVRRRLRTELFEPDSSLDAALARDSVSGPLLREFALMSRGKFSIETILESFNYGDAAEKARVRMIPEENIDRNAYLARQTPEIIGQCQIALDIVDEGYRAILHWFDRMLALYERLVIEAHYVEVEAQSAEPDLDLFEWSAQNSKGPHPLNELLCHLLEQGMVVYCASERQERVARLLLLLHTIRVAADRGVRLEAFPRIDAAIQPRPKVLDSDRRAMYQSASTHEWQVI